MPVRRTVRPLRRLAPALLLLLAAAAPLRPAAAADVTLAPPSAAQLQGLVETLQNDQARTRLVTQLQALIAAQRQAPPAAAPGDFVGELSHRLNAFAGEVLAGVAVVLDAPRLLAWARYQIADPAARSRWAEVLLACAVVFGAAVLAEMAVRRFTARLARRLMPPQRDGRVLRLVFIAAGVLLDLLPVAAFSGAAVLAMAIMLPPFSIGRAAIAVLVEATISARLILAAATAVLLPGPALPSLVPAGEETRNYLLIWGRRLTCWAVFGYGVAGAAWWLGIPGAVYALILKIVALGLAILGTVFVLQNREPVARWIAGRGGAEPGGWTRLRRHFAETWHALAIFYIGAIFLAYALHDEGGSAFVLRGTALSLATIAAAWLLVRFIERLSERGFAVAPDLKARFPLLEARANRYLPVVVGIATAVVYAVALIVVLQAWGLGAFAWLSSGFGRRLSGALLSSALVLIVALLAWEMLSAAIERNLAALDHDGVPSRTRRRTLLPLLRTTMLGVITVVAALVILSQIGIDIAPLLAGAGVVGVAIGFGSQALIKDVITGLFILIEDQIAVGDIVDVGKDHAGVVEAISVRTIRLRDLGGVVHTVPFSEVTTVKNLTRDFAYAVARVTIAYGEDIDRAVEILRGVCDELAVDPEIGPLILDRFDYQGVDALNEFSVVLLLRVRTLPGKQWVVGRALNRLIKEALERHGVAMRDPSPVLLTGGNAASREIAAAGRQSHAAA